MKRLIRKSDAIRLSNLGLDPNLVFTEIQNADWQFHPDKLITDIGGEYAIWGAVSDDGQYIVELYVYSVEFGKKCATVTCKIENEMPSTNIEVAGVTETDSAANSKNTIISNGITINGRQLTFQNSYRSINDVEYSTENIAKIKRK